jgi:GntR family transcriptional regulator
VLGIEPGVSLIALRKTSIDTIGRVVEVADVLMAGDRTELVYTTDLKRYPT